MINTSRPLFLLINLIFFASGFLGLAYQVLWSRFIHDFVGVSSYSYSVVLAAFMGGMAIGSSFLGRWMDKRSNPLKVYAYIEILIGLFVIVFFEPLLAILFQWYGSFYEPGWSGNSAYAISLKLLCSTILLLVPTVLMGATFPAMVKITKQFKESVGSAAALCYGVNASGAVLGSVAMAFLILPSLGMKASLYLGGMSSALLGVVSFLLCSRIREEETPEHHEIHHKPDAVQKFLLLLIFFEGILGFSLEIAWTRNFALVFGSSTYSFATMLSALILGISLGSLTLSRLELKIRSPLHAFGVSQLLMGISLLMTLPLYPYLPLFFKTLYSSLSATPWAYGIYEFSKFALSFCLMLIPSFFGGMSLPLIVKAFAKRDASLGAESGLVYAADTLGNVSGALLGALILLPLMGLQNLMTSIAIGCVLLGFLSIYRSLSLDSVPWGRSPSLVAIVLVLFAPIWWQDWELKYFASLPHRRFVAPKTWQEALDWPDWDVLYNKDDPASSVMIIKGEDGVTRLLNNGKPDATDVADMLSQTLTGHIPMLINPSAKDVLLVGMGSGVSAGAVLRHPVKSLKVIELVEGVVEAEKFFRHVNYDPTSDPRTEVIIDDAKGILTFDSSTYDAIISVPSNPWQAGVASLFSHEYYQLVKSRLREGGVFLQWMQRYEMSDAVFFSAVRTVRSVFPYLYGFQSSGDLLILGSMKPVKIDEQDLRARLSSPEVKKSLEEWSLTEPYQFLALQTQTAQTMDALASLGPIVNDADNLFLEHQAPTELFFSRSASIMRDFDDRKIQSPALLWSQISSSSMPLPVKSFDANMESFKALSHRYVSASLLAYYFEQLEIHKKDYEAVDLPPNFLIYSFSELTQVLDKLMAKEQYNEQIAIWNTLGEGFDLFVHTHPEFAPQWIANFEKWLDRDLPGAVHKMYMRRLVTLELNLGDSTSLWKKINKHFKKQDHRFIAEMTARVCQSKDTRICLAMKAKMISEGFEYPVGSIADFPANQWSLPAHEHVESAPSN